jgi:hypothetical protein
MKRVLPILAAGLFLTACTPPPAPPKPGPPIPAAAAAASLRLDVNLNEMPDGGLVAVGKVVNTGDAPLQVGRELKLSFQFEPNELGAPRFGGNPFSPEGQPQFVALTPLAATPRTRPAPGVEEAIPLAAPADRVALQDGRLRVMAQVSVLPAGTDPRAIEAREVPLVTVMELHKSPRSVELRRQ